MNKNISGNKISKMALKAGIWYTISSILLRAIAIITTPIYTRLLSTNDYGIVATFNSWSTILTIICSLNLVYSIGRAKQDFPGDLRKYTSSMQVLSVVFTTFIVVVALIFIESVSNFTELDTNILIALIIYLMFIPAVTFVQSEFRFEYKYKENILISIYIALATIIFSIILIYCFPSQKYLGRILGTVLPIVFLSIFLWIKKIKEKEVSINYGHWKYGIYISLPLMLHVLSLNILTQIDRIFISKMSGNETVGIYSLAYQYAILISVVTNAVSEAWQPWFFDKYASGEVEEVKKAVIPFTIIGCFISLCCIAIAPEAIWVLGGTAFENGKWAVYPITLGILCQYIYTHYINIELYYKKTYYISAGTVLSALINIVLNILLIPHYGFIGSAYATLISYVLLLLVHYIIATRIIKINIYNNISLFILLILTSLLSGVFVLLYDWWLVRYSILIIICIIYFSMNRRYISAIVVKKLKKSIY